MLGILGTVVQRERLAAPRWKLLEPTNDRLVRLCGALPGKLRDQDDPALAFDQSI